MRIELRSRAMPTNHMNHVTEIPGTCTCISTGDISSLSCVTWPHPLKNGLLFTKRRCKISSKIGKQIGETRSTKTNKQLHYEVE